MADTDHDTRIQRTYGRPAEPSPTTPPAPSGSPEAELQARIQRTYSKTTDASGKKADPSPEQAEVDRRTAKTYGLKLEPQAAAPTPTSTPVAAPALRLPEGLDPKAPEFIEFSKTIDGLEPARAQKVLDWWHGKQTAELKAADDQVDSWRKTSISDTEFGGDRFKESLGASKGLIAEFGSDGLRELVDGPIGNHPEVIRFLTRVAKALRNARGQ